MKIVKVSEFGFLLFVNCVKWVHVNIIPPDKYMEMYIHVLYIHNNK